MTTVQWWGEKPIFRAGRGRVKGRRDGAACCARIKHATIRGLAQLCSILRPESRALISTSATEERCHQQRQHPPPQKMIFPAAVKTKRRGGEATHHCLAKEPPRSLRQMPSIRPTPNLPTLVRRLLLPPYQNHHERHVKSCERRARQLHSLLDRPQRRSTSPSKILLQLRKLWLQLSPRQIQQQLRSSKQLRQLRLIRRQLHWPLRKR